MSETCERQPKRILLVEDEYLVAEDMAYELRRLGFEVLGPIANVALALRLVDREPVIDGAVLDVNLNGESSYDVADALLARDVPFAFMTGYDENSLPARFAAVARFNKPVTRAILHREIAKEFADR